MSKPTFFFFVHFPTNSDLRPASSPCCCHPWLGTRRTLNGTTSGIGSDSISDIGGKSALTASGNGNLISGSIGSNGISDIGGRSALTVSGGGDEVSVTISGPIPVAPSSVLEWWELLSSAMRILVHLVHLLAHTGHRAGLVSGDLWYASDGVDWYRQWLLGRPRSHRSPSMQNRIAL